MPICSRSACSARTARPPAPPPWCPNAGRRAPPTQTPVFASVSGPLFHPLIAAKEFVTADHIGAGRFGLNIVAGWNEGEFEMFGVTQRAHDDRYEFAEEWLAVVKRAWGTEEQFDFKGQFFDLRGG